MCEKLYELLSRTVRGRVPSKDLNIKVTMVQDENIVFDIIPVDSDEKKESFCVSRDLFVYRATLSNSSLVGIFIHQFL